MFEDNHGVPHIGNLFADFDMSSLPDAINGPTQARLNRFLRDDLKLAITAPELSVRGIVAEMMKFNASGSLCWDVFGHGGAKTSSLVETTSAQVELRRVAGRCAAYVFTIVEEADEERRQAGKAGNFKTLRTRANAKVRKGVHLGRGQTYVARLQLEPAGAKATMAAPVTAATPSLAELDVQQVGSDAW